ncbi:AP-3 complex subunit beta-2-like [Sinocyclocheilus grahami]|uniref:AP-3 complex subunit beta-2-like n=1 Tax=Sinocyclocheilus grahami TaxID=75366 RepID=UPI0007AD1A2B|nr:PREDICTED: AP-3 complex subunit beta-2-like [Sinocyclocheilus grahami]
MAASSAFSDEKGGSASEPEYGHDPASGGIFSSDYKRHDDLKEMLDSNKDSLKLEAMKRIVAMIARGKNASDLFPAVVKNVACKIVKKLVYVYLVRYAEEQQDLALLSISTFQRGLKVKKLVYVYLVRYAEEQQDLALLSISTFQRGLKVKKLVYVYLVRYAEEQQDLALLSISTFQRGLKDPNQLIRASALRVLSSIRVTIIVPIMMLAIKEAASDMSPYVRKTAAHAIPKLHSLDPEQKDQLIEVIEKLLADKTTLVAGSVVMAFEEVCPDRIDLIHKNYRKLCNLLIDVEEWGQVVIINMLTRYARTQFLNPNVNESLLEESSEKAFYASDDEEDEDKKAEVTTLEKRKPYVMDPDHRLLLRNTKPLLQSRNAATYIKSMDKDFVAASIQAIGRCATNIGEVRDTCLNGLVQLLSNRDELVVAESVVVIKKLLQMQPEQHSDIIKHMAKLIDNIQVPMARASILWLIGEYCEHVPKIAPDVLRKMAKSFTNEEDIVKLQIINLAAKLYLTNSKQSKLLTQYVLNLAKYDQNYDIRDRARFIRQLIVPTDKSGALNKYAKKLFLALKPAPVLESPFKDRDHFQLGSLSHLLNAKAAGYQELPDWPESAPDPSVRNVEVKDSIPDWSKCSSRKDRKEKKVEKPFYSDSEGESGPTESADSESDSGSGSASASGSDESGSGSESEESREETESEEEEEDEEEERKKRKKLDKTKAKKQAEESAESEQSSGAEDRKRGRKAVKNQKSASESESESESSESEDESEEESEEESESDTDVRKKKTPVSKQPPKQSKKESKKETQEMSLLDLDDFEPAPASAPVTPVNFLSISLVSDLEGLSLTDTILAPTTIAPSGLIKMYELLHRITGEGLAVEYCFSRQPFSPDPNMVAVQIQFTNNTNSETKNLHIEDPRLQSGMRIREFAEIDVLTAGESVTVVMGIDFCDSTQAANFQLCTHTRKFFVSIQPPVGELMTPAFLTENDFKKEQGKLMGMNEILEKLTLGEKCVNEHVIVERVTATANLSRVPCGSDKECRFAGKTVSSGCLVLVTVTTKEGGGAQLTVNCEKMVIGTMLVKDILQALSQ